MKTFLIVLFVVLQLSQGTAFAQEKDKEGFTLVRQDRNISVFEKWMTWPGSTPPDPSRELKCEFYYKNTIYAGLHLIKDDKQVMNWQTHVSEYKIYLQQDTTAWFEYSYHDIPWPVSDQDHYMEYKVVAKSPTLLLITFKSRVNNNVAPQRKGVTRLQLTGSWTLEQVSPEKVKATYRVLSKPIDIPKIFIDPIIRGNMVTTMAEFSNIIEAKEKL
ncbi:MAG: hypothetical protein ABI477_21040 [Chryseolinea sp.]